MLHAIHHIAVICSDYARSRRFYAEILGLPVLREVWRAERGSWKCDLGVGPAQIELFSFPSPPPRPTTPEACGLRHLAFAVPALEPVIARLTAHDVAVEAVRIDEHTGRRFTFFRDPDGLPLELYEEPPAGLPPS
ncbi:SMU1112c/YaeR family gloxylase I-like metalloprotein [Labrys monachus]|uniref:Glyoxylase I family protein n=1 Tax=Labrys monachus TaxID=217067 RepID=A0ABU0FG27_9HYPH|nr:VOC family protein [Labrys monachus]MDQ0393000.1 glyoxylase I family protein [Labrys monachus]